MTVKACHISVQDVDGRWHQLGAGALRGVWPESIELVSDEGGPKTATFELHREPEVAWPDLGAYAPMEAHVGGRLRWTGRIIDAPTRSAERVISVQAEGWQAHLDDDQYERMYVHTRLADWKDARSVPDAHLGAAYACAAGQVSADGAITLTFPNDTAITSNSTVQVTLDLGESRAERVVVGLDLSNNSGDATVKLYGSNRAGEAQRAYDLGDLTTGDSVLNNAGTPNSLRATFATPVRYVMIALQWTGASATTAADVWARISSALVFSDTAYETGDASVLRGDQVVTDALDRATMLLASDRTRVEQTTDFSVPEFAPDGPRTPRQACEAVNVFFDRQLRVDEQQRVVYRERPDVPDVVVGPWGASDFDNASNASGADIASKAIARGEDPAGAPVSVTRSQAEQPGTTFDAIATPAPTNGTFEAGVTGWTASSSTRTQDTGVFETGSASLRWDNTGANDALAPGDTLEGTFTGTFLAGVPYALSLAFKYAATSGKKIEATFGAIGTDSVVGSLDASSTGWQTAVLAWTPSADRTGVTVKLTVGPPVSTYIRLDTVGVSAARPTIVDKRGFRKAHTLDSGFTLTALSAQRLADKYLQAHRTTPFKGRGQATGHNAIRDYTTGQAISPDTLLVLTGGLMHFGHLIDPDTGNLGRDGRLVRVAYRPETDTASYDIDSTRGDFDRTLQRAGVLVGQLR